MFGMCRERCGNCISFEPLSEDVLKQYKDDPRVHIGDGTCARGPFLKHPHVRPGDKCNPIKLVDGFEAFVRGTEHMDLKTSRFKSNISGEDSINNRLKQLRNSLSREIFKLKRKKEDNYWNWS